MLCSSSCIIRYRYLALCATVLILCVWTGTAGAGLVAQYHFDEMPGTTVAHDSVGGHDGVLSGSAGFELGGISGHAVHLDKAQNGLVNMGDNFRFTDTDFTIVSWVKTQPGDESRDLIFVAKHRSTLYAGYFLAMNYSGGTYGALDKAWFYTGGYPGHEPISVTSVNDGQWHQVVGVYHYMGMQEIYVDGNLEDLRPAHPIAANDAPFLIGGIDVSGVPTALLNNVSVDEVSIYDSALDGQSIAYLYQHPGQVALERTSPPGFFNPGWNWFSLPLIPDDPSVTSIFGANDLTNRLYWWDPVGKTITLYPDDFTTLGVQESYLAFLGTTFDITLTGVPTPPGYSVSVPEAGWTWVGFPKTGTEPLSGVMVRNVTMEQTRTAAEDAAAPDAWLNWNWVYWDSVADTARILGFSGSDDTMLHPWYGYRVWANTRNLEIVYPEP